MAIYVLEKAFNPFPARQKTPVCNLKGEQNAAENRPSGPLLS
jgi:hypothetical protein